MTTSEKTKEVKELVYKIAKEIPFNFLINVTINKNEVTVNDLVKIIVKFDEVFKCFRYYFSRKLIYPISGAVWEDKKDWDYYDEPIPIIGEVFETILNQEVFKASMKVRKKLEENNNAKNLL